MSKRIDIKPITDEEFDKVNEAVKRLGLKSRTDYFRLIINLDAATGIIETLRNLQFLKTDE